MARRNPKTGKRAVIALLVLACAGAATLGIIKLLPTAASPGALPTPTPGFTPADHSVTITPPPPPPGREEAAEIDVGAAVAPAQTGEVRKCRGSDVRIRSAPTTADTKNVVGFLQYEQRVTVTGQTEGIVSGKPSLFYTIEAEGLDPGGVYYVYAHYIVPVDAALYGRGPSQEGSAVVRGQNRHVTDDLVDVRWYIDDIEVALILAGTENITGKAQYARPVPLLQRGTVKKLLAASKRFAEDGYTIKLYDAYRPLSVQRTLFALVGNSSYVANPNTTASNHNRGAAVDISLIGSDGVEMETPTPMHTFDKRANRSQSQSWPEQVQRNVAYMTEVMQASGFETIKSEWWHFTDTDHASYMTTDHDFNDIPMYTAEEMLTLENSVP